MNIKYKYCDTNRHLTIKAPERFSFNNYKELFEVFEDVKEGMKKVTVDMLGTEHIDSTAIGLIMLLIQHCNITKLNFEIINASPRVCQLLRTVKLDQYLNG